MKQYLSYIINGILGIAVVILFILHFTDSSSVSTSSERNKKNKKIESVGDLPIAYINIDTLLLNYNFAKDAQFQVLSKGKKAELMLNQKLTKWQDEAAEFQRKYQSNSFLSKDRAEQENNRLMKKRQELEQLGMKLREEQMTAEKNMYKQLNDTIDGFLKEYNKDKKYQIILSNTMSDNVLYSEEGYNITSEVIDLLNARYVKDAK